MPSSFQCPRGRIAAAALVLTAAALTGCTERAESPTDPSTEPQTATSEATASLAAAPALVQVSAGGRSTCGVTSAGQAYCWGANLDGQLGNGSTQSSRRPVQVTGNLSFRQISAGDSHTCAVSTDNRVYCWGQPTLVGVASPPASVTEPVPVASSLRFQTVAASGSHTCAITVDDRRAYCWGHNSAGGLGDGTMNDRRTPVAVAGSHAWRQVSTGHDFTCGITTANLAWCWGIDRSGALGDGATEQFKLIPVRVAGDHRFIRISSGDGHTCAVTGAGRAWCWGDGFAGSIGDGNTLDRYTPRAVAGGHTFDRVSAGGNLTCAESTSNTTYCWGYNAFGQIGNGSTSPSQVTRPSLVVGGFRFVQVDAGQQHACGRTSDGVVRCWGANFDGQLGDGTTTNRAEPTLIVGP